MKLTKPKFLLSLLVSSLLYGNEAILKEQEYVVINTEYVNLRSTPMVSSNNIVSKLPLGDVYKFIDYDGNWIKIGENQYLDKRLVDRFNAENSFAVVVTSKYATLRSKPILSKSSRIRSLNEGELLEVVTSLSDDWYLLRDGNYVHTSSVKRADKQQAQDTMDDTSNIQSGSKILASTFGSIDKEEIASTLEIMQNSLIKLIEENNELKKNMHGNKKELVAHQHQINLLTNNIKELELLIKNENNSKIVDNTILGDYYLVSRNAFKRKTPTQSKDSFGFIYRGNIVKVTEKTTNDYFKVGDYWISTEHLTPLSSQNNGMLENFVKFSDLVIVEINELKDQNKQITTKIEDMQRDISELKVNSGATAEKIDELAKDNQQLITKIDEQYKIVNSNILSMDKKDGELETRFSKAFDIYDTRMLNIESSLQTLSKTVINASSKEVSISSDNKAVEKLIKENADLFKKQMLLEKKVKELEDDLSTLLKLSKKGKL